MSAPRKSPGWRTIAKVAVFGVIAIASIPFVLVALFGNAGGRRS